MLKDESYERLVDLNYSVFISLKIQTCASCTQENECNITTKRTYKQATFVSEHHLGTWIIFVGGKGI